MEVGEKLFGPFELFYDEMMEGPIDCEFLRFLDANYVMPRMGALAEFLITDGEHLSKYDRAMDRPFSVTARFSPERPARHDEYVFRIKGDGDAQI